MFVIAPLVAVEMLYVCTYTAYCVYGSRDDRTAAMKGACFDVSGGMSMVFQLAKNIETSLTQEIRLLSLLWLHLC